MEILPYCRVEAIDRERHEVLTNQGSRAYGRLVLALGADPNVPDVPGSGAGEVFRVNTLDDYSAFRKAIPAGGRVLIIGAGLVGCEFANDLAVSGHHVAVVEASPLPLLRLMPATMAEDLRNSLGALGVR